MNLETQAAFLISALRAGWGVSFTVDAADAATFDLVRRGCVEATVRQLSGAPENCGKMEVVLTAQCPSCTRDTCDFQAREGV